MARLAAGDALVLPPEVTTYLDALRALGVSEPMLRGERDGWILMAARWPDEVLEWIPAKLASLQDPRIVRLYLVLPQLFDDPELDEPLMREAADLMAGLSEQALADGEVVEAAMGDDTFFDLLDLLARDTDPRSSRMVELMRERGWAGWTRLERVPVPPT